MAEDEGMAEELEEIEAEEEPFGEGEEPFAEGEESFAEGEEPFVEGEEEQFLEGGEEAFLEGEDQRFQDGEEPLEGEDEPPLEGEEPFVEGEEPPPEGEEEWQDHEALDPGPPLIHDAWGKKVVNLRQKLKSVEDADRFIIQLSNLIDQFKAESKTLVFEDFDISQNPIPTEQLESIFGLLTDAECKVQVERFRAFGCATLDNAAAVLLAEWLRNVTKDTAPFELHLSDCAITGDGYTEIVRAIEANDTFPAQDPKNRHKGKLPLYVRVEANYIPPEIIQESIDSGTAMVALKSSGSPHHTDKHKMRLMMMRESKDFQQKTGEPPPVENWPAPRPVKDGKGKGKDFRGQTHGSDSRAKGGAKGSTRGRGDYDNRNSGGYDRSRSDRGYGDRSGRGSDRGYDRRADAGSSRGYDRDRRQDNGRSDRGGRTTGSWQSQPSSDRRDGRRGPAQPEPRRRDATTKPPGDFRERAPPGNFRSPIRREERPAPAAKNGSGRDDGRGGAPYSAFGGRSSGAGPGGKGGRQSDRAPLAQPARRGDDRGRDSRRDPPGNQRSAYVRDKRERAPLERDPRYDRSRQGDDARKRQNVDSGPAPRSDTRRVLSPPRRPTRSTVVGSSRPAGKSSGARPSATAGPRDGGRKEPSRGLKAPWEEHFSEEYNLPYFWNTVTGESSWDIPR